MNSLKVLLHEMETANDKEAWFPPLLTALDGLTAEQAGWRPAGEAANTIQEIASHLLYYKERLLERLKGLEPNYYAADNDATFAGATENAEQTWQNTVSRLKAVHQELTDHLRGMTEETLDRPLSSSPIGIALADITMHDAYHTGQIVQIRKLQGSWPARRSFE